MSLALLALIAAVAQERPYLGQPSITAAGRSVAFVRSGDLYEVSVDGGRARLLTTDRAYDTRPRYSPDGRWLAFTSFRSGGGDVYVLERRTGELRRLTFHDARDTVDGWSPDSSFVYFSSSRHDISGYSDLYKVSIVGGTPILMSGDRYEGEYQAAVSRDGAWLAFNANDRTRQWWRLGPRKSDSTEIWLKSNRPDARDYRRVTSYAGKDSWPLWRGEGELVFVTDDGGGGVENLCAQTLDGRRQLLTHFDDGRVLWPDIATDGTIVFERDFAIWSLDTDGEVRRLDIELPLARRRELPGRQIVDGQVSEFELSPTGEQLAFIVRGEIFVADAREPHGRGAVQITHTREPEFDLAWSPDGLRLAYTSRRTPDAREVYWFDFRSGTEEQLTRSGGVATTPVFSPDGRWLVYRQGTTALELVDLDSRESDKFVESLLLSSSYAWSPDSRFIAFFGTDANWYSNVYVRDVARLEPARQLSRVPAVFQRSLLWSPDGRFLVFSVESERPGSRTFRIDLFDEPAATAEPLRAVFGWSESATAAARSRHVERPRVRRLLAETDAVAVALGPGPRELIYSTTRDGRRVLRVGSTVPGNLRTRAFDEGRSAVRLAPDREAVWYLQDQKIRRRALATGDVSEYSTAVLLDVDAQADREQTFLEGWAALGQYAGELDDGDWREAYARYLPYVRGARCDEEFELIASLMIGGLNTSHVGFRAPSTSAALPVADLGVDFDPVELERGVHRVNAIVTGGPADRSGAFDVGVMLVSVDGVLLTAARNYYAALEGKVGRPIEVAIRSADGDRTVFLTGARSATINEHRYEAWVHANRELVERLSDGRLGYVHVRHFGTGSLDLLDLALDSELRGRGGFVLDIRYNGGGWASNAAAALLQRRVTHNSRFRDFEAANATILGVSVVDRPCVLVQNEQCLSDSENFSEAFRQLGIGKIVGMPTAAWVVGRMRYTTSLGFSVGLPAWRTYSADGDDMDLVPRPPDVLVDRPIGQGLTGDDAQLSRAVEELLADLDR